MVVVLPESFPRDGSARNFAEPNSRATPQSLDPRSKMEKVVPEMERQRFRYGYNPRDKLHLAVDDGWR